MALPRSQEDGRLEEPPACREDGRHLARRVHRLLRTHRGPPRPHHFPKGALRQGELLEQDEVPALCWHRGWTAYHRWCSDVFPGVAKDLIAACHGHEILRCAQDDSGSGNRLKPVSADSATLLKLVGLDQ